MQYSDIEYSDAIFWCNILMPPSSFQNLEPAEDGFPAKRLQDGIAEDALRSSGVYHHK